jgi:hypothetical protein
MEVRKGDWVLVNLAPFIGSSQRSRVGVPCRVLAVTATHVEVVTEQPFREVSLCVLSTWIERKLEPDPEPAPARTPGAVGARKAAVAVG